MEQSSPESSSTVVQRGQSDVNCVIKKLVESLACFAFAIFVMGAVFGAAWPAAVAVCGLSILGLGAAYLMSRRS